MNNKISDKDKKEWQNFLDNNEKLPDKDLSNSQIKPKLSRSLDLHGYTLDEANREIQNFISKAFNDGIKKLIVVTGKGIHSGNEKNPYVSKDLSILKHSVPEYIRNNSDLKKKILSLEIAENSDGGSGAFYIYLKKNNK